MESLETIRIYPNIPPMEIDEQSTNVDQVATPLDIIININNSVNSLTERFDLNFPNKERIIILKRLTKLWVALLICIIALGCLVDFAIDIVPCYEDKNCITFFKWTRMAIFALLSFSTLYGLKSAFIKFMDCIIKCRKK